MNNKKNDQFFSLYDSIKETFGKDKLDKKTEELKAVKLYNRIRIEKIKKHSKAIDIIHNKLIVLVDDNSALQFIQLYTNKLIRAINKKLGENIVKKISYRVCTNKEDNFSDNIKPHKNRVIDNDIEKIELNREDILKIEDIVNNIQEKDVYIVREIKEKLKKLFISNMKYNKFKKD